MNIELKTITPVLRGQKGFTEAQDERYKKLMHSISYHNKSDIMKRNSHFQDILNGTKILLGELTP